MCVDFAIGFGWFVFIRLPLLKINIIPLRSLLGASYYLYILQRVHSASIFPVVLAFDKYVMLRPSDYGPLL